MAAHAKITVTSGPDRGKSFDLSGDLVRLGRGEGNELVFSDTQLAEHHASIVQRDGRFAISTTSPDGIDIDGTEVPPDQWVWLPDTAQIRISRRTSIQFTCNGEAANASSAATTQVVSPAARPASTTSTTVPRGKKTINDGTGSSGEGMPRQKRAGSTQVGKRTIARFITDGPGDPLVKLGEDGHLPELSLHEAEARKSGPAKAKSSNPLLLLGALGLSFGVTILMLFMETGIGGSGVDKTKARREIVEYYGKEDENLQPYQVALRQARQAASRGDREAERAEYFKVLKMLRSESRDKVTKFTGLTGRLDYDPDSDNKKSDKRLEELIGILLNQD